MSKQNKEASQKSGAAVTSTDKVEWGMRDYISHIKKVIKAKKTLEGIGGMKEAIEKCDATIKLVREKIHKMVDADIDARLKDE